MLDKIIPRTAEELVTYTESIRKNDNGYLIDKINTVIINQDGISTKFKTINSYNPLPNIVTFMGTSSEPFYESSLFKTALALTDKVDINLVRTLLTQPTRLNKEIVLELLNKSFFKTDFCMDRSFFDLNILRWAQLIDMGLLSVNDALRVIDVYATQRFGYKLFSGTLEDTSILIRDTSILQILFSHLGTLNNGDRGHIANFIDTFTYNSLINGPFYGQKVSEDRILDYVPMIKFMMSQKEGQESGSHHRVSVATEPESSMLAFYEIVAASSKHKYITAFTKIVLSLFKSLPPSRTPSSRAWYRFSGLSNNADRFLYRSIVASTLLIQVNHFLSTDSNKLGYRSSVPAALTWLASFVHLTVYNRYPEMLKSHVKIPGQRPRMSTLKKHWNKAYKEAIKSSYILIN